MCDSNFKLKGRTQAQVQTSQQHPPLSFLHSITIFLDMYGQHHLMHTASSEKARWNRVRSTNVTVKAESINASRYHLETHKHTRIPPKIRSISCSSDSQYFCIHRLLCKSRLQPPFPLRQEPNIWHLLRVDRDNQRELTHKPVYLDTSSLSMRLVQVHSRQMSAGSLMCATH